MKFEMPIFLIKIYFIQSLRQFLNLFNTELLSCFIVAVSLSIFSIATYAQNELSSTKSLLEPDKKQEINTVLKTSSTKKEKSLNDAPLATIEISATSALSPLIISTNPKKPRQPIPASDGADYLKTIPGFSTIRNGGTNGEPILRGMFGSRLNILSNGAALFGACPGRMDTSTSYISPESYDKLTVIKGPQTVIWGPGASAGTILFERKTPRFEKPGIRFDGSLVGGSNARNDQNADMTVGNAQIYTRVSANHGHSNDYKDGNGKTVPSRWDKWNTDATIGMTPDNNTRMELTAGTGDGDARYASHGMDGIRFKRESLGLSFEKENINALLKKLEAKVYYNYVDHVMDNVTYRQPNPNSGMPMPMATDLDRQTKGARVAATLEWSDQFKLITGIDIQTNKHGQRSAMGATNYQNKPWNQDAEMANYGAFGELNWYANEMNRVITGVRLDYAIARDERYLVDKLSNPTVNQRRTKILKSGFIRYEHDLADSPTSLYAGIGHVERFPDYWELFSADNGPAGSINSFMGIQPEKTTQLDIGAQFTTAQLKTWISAYAGYVNDFILFNYSPASMHDSQASNINATIAGGELGADYAFNHHWKATSALAYAWGNNRNNDRPLPQMPPVDFRLGLQYEKEKLSAGILWRLVGAQRRIAQYQGNVVGQDLGPSATFNVFSVNAGYAFTHKVQLTTGIDNLFNKTYAEHLNKAGNSGFGYPSETLINEPGRIFWARLNFKY